MKSKDIKIGEIYAYGTSRDTRWNRKCRNKVQVVEIRKSQSEDGYEFMYNPTTVVVIRFWDYNTKDWRESPRVVRPQTIRALWSDHEKVIAEDDRIVAEREAAWNARSERYKEIAIKLVGLGLLKEAYLKGDITGEMRRFYDNPLKRLDIDASNKLVDLAIKGVGASDA